jgi:hypothetical protein
MVEFKIVLYVLETFIHIQYPNHKENLTLYRSLYSSLALCRFIVKEVPFVHLKCWIFNIPLLFISFTTYPTVQFTYKHPLVSICRGKGESRARCVPYHRSSRQAKDKLTILSFLSMSTLHMKQVHWYVAFTFWSKHVNLTWTFCCGDSLSCKSNLRQFTMSSCPVKSRHHREWKTFNSK